jgi:RNA polymerase sigma-70 factor (ECF subfamily)
VETLPQSEPTSREDRFLALAELVAAPLRRYAVRRTDPDTAQEVLADTMLVLWRRLDDVPADDPLPWCYAVARRCLANAQRAGRRQARLVERIALYRESPPVQAPPLVDDVLHMALAKVSDTEQELLRLWAWEELEPREIARVLGITPNAVSIRLHRAKKKVAILLAES